MKLDFAQTVRAVGVAALAAAKVANASVVGVDNIGTNSAWTDDMAGGFSGVSFGGTNNVYGVFAKPLTNQWSATVQGQMLNAVVFNNGTGTSWMAATAALNLWTNAAGQSAEQRFTNAPFAPDISYPLGQLGPYLTQYGSTHDPLGTNHNTYLFSRPLRGVIPPDTLLFDPNVTVWAAVGITDNASNGVTRVSQSRATNDTHAIVMQGRQKVGTTAITNVISQTVTNAPAFTIEATGPMLSRSLNGTNFVASYPARYQGYHAVFTGSLASPNWGELSLPVVTNGDRVEISVPAIGNGFVRVKN